MKSLGFVLIQEGIFLAAGLIALLLKEYAWAITCLVAALTGLFSISEGAGYNLVEIDHVKKEEE